MFHIFKYLKLQLQLVNFLVITITGAWKLYINLDNNYYTNLKSHIVFTTLNENDINCEVQK